VESKKRKPNSLPTHHKAEIMTALSMTQDVGATLQVILAKLEKSGSIESQL